MNWREAKGEEEINIYQSERRRRTIHSLPKESRVNEENGPILQNLVHFPTLLQQICLIYFPLFPFTGSFAIRVVGRRGEEESG